MGGAATDAGRGWRHVVPSPKPRHIVDISLIQVLARRGTVVIAGGGGGIPRRAVLIRTIRVVRGVVRRPYAAHQQSAQVSPGAGGTGG